VLNTQAAAKDHRPVYIQIAETLRARIVSGYYEDKIDGELPLASEWKVSRRTIQQALELLVQEGLLVRQHGMGTFINRKGVEKRYRAITSITEGISGQGLKPEFTVLASGPAVASGEERAFFRINPGEQVYRHKRLVAADGRALAVVETSLNLKFLEGLELSHLSQSLYQTLRNQFGRTVVQAEDKYIPSIADAETAKLLGINPGSAIFLAIRRATDQTGAPIELSEISMLPVPLDISIRNIGFPRKGPDDLTPESREWTYTVGFGDFHK
jgi:DNA-binding GntR family transcriptional regulator